MHRKRPWRPFRRARCDCGLPWPCLELRLRETQRAPEPTTRNWAAPTQAWPQVGRAGRLTPAQMYRANGGHW